MPDEEINISALLRLKRYEQPPPGYFDRLLQDVHRRQRSELLHRPLWRIGVDRLQTFFSEHSMSGVSYAGAMAVLLVVGVAGIGLMTPGEFQNTAPGLVAKARDEAQPQSRVLSLESKRVSLESGAEFQRPSASDGAGRDGIAPRYIIDARPVSYDRPPSF